MTDTLLRGIFPKSSIRFSITQAAGVCSEGIRMHGSDFVSGWLLGEALTTAVLLSTLVKGDEKYTLRWQYPGPAGTILADLNEAAEVRGYTQTIALLELAPTLEEALGGDGKVSVVTHTATRVVRTGVTEALFRDIPRDMAHFLSFSHQTETALAVGLVMPPTQPVHLTSALGLILQPLPGSDLERFESARQLVEQPDFRTWLETGEPQPLEVLHRLKLGEEPQILTRTTPRYRCGCSREKIDMILRMLPQDELREMAEEGPSEVTCHFCGARYVHSPDELNAILHELAVTN
ncbi:MAG: Hsp33 family molecular chaperone HslO [Deltaproteobacteria bacterium]|nr:Hsp33 family molecular chaperone HslO [Deltaproteobacteria bacterium]